MKALLCCLMLATTFLAANSADAGKKKKKKVETWNLNIKFVIGSDTWDTDRDALKAFIATQVDIAEKIFADKPKLKINYILERKTKLGSQPTNRPTFDKEKEYRKWMDQYVDNVAKSKTDGYITVLVVDSFCFKNKKKKAKKTGEKFKCPGGKAWFPHWVTPFTRKHGIVVVAGNDKHTLAHEIGHILGLKHTFASYVNVDNKLNCNKDYKPKGKADGRCRSCKGKRSGSGDKATCSGQANFMDYCFTSTQYINDCQKRRAANQRRTYMTKKGKTNYKKLTGNK